MHDHPDFTAAATDRDFFTGPVPDPQDWDPKFNAWNAEHHAVKRVSAEVFVLVGQGQETGTYVVVSAKQAAMFVRHNEELWYKPNAKDCGEDPLYYPQFAMHLTSFDQSTDLWAFYDNQEKRYRYPVGDPARDTIPTWGSWLVCPQHIGEYRVPSDKALVSKERQWERNLLRQAQARHKRESERDARGRGIEPYADAKSRKDIRAAILARTQATNDDDQAGGGRRAHGKARQHLPTHAAPLQAPADQQTGLGATAFLSNAPSTSAPLPTSPLPTIFLPSPPLIPLKSPRRPSTCRPSLRILTICPTPTYSNIWTRKRLGRRRHTAKTR
ncbi:hypothetical protein C8R46DRAFT_1046237 [Mycena filopes]|nr:hypothetical protein C8R46DRAFT_1046237 [Mycena filopes]